MSDHRAHIHWRRATPDFDIRTYNRRHDWTFPRSGQALAGSAAPQYRGDADCVDPEEALVASISACHMLTFLALAAKAGFSVDAYEDDASGVLQKNADGVLAMTHVTLRPNITFSGAAAGPDPATLRDLHHRAHAGCIIANSIKTEVTVEQPQAAVAD